MTDAVVDEIKLWRARPLDQVYPIVYQDCIHVKVRDGAVLAKAVYLAIGITLTGEKEVLGLWLSQNEGAKSWLQVVTELKNRGVQDILIACVDGLKGFPEAIEAVFPATTVQLCIVHMVRHSLNYVSWKRRVEVAADLKRIYTSATVEEAELRLGEFEAKWEILLLFAYAVAYQYQLGKHVSQRQGGTDREQWCDPGIQAETRYRNVQDQRADEVGGEVDEREQYDLA